MIELLTGQYVVNNPNQKALIHTFDIWFDKRKTLRQLNSHKISFNNLTKALKASVMYRNIFVTISKVWCVDNRNGKNCKFKFGRVVKRKILQPLDLFTTFGNTKLKVI